jgi:hypothetical protein
MTAGIEKLPITQNFFWDTLAQWLGIKGQRGIHLEIRFYSGF